MNPSRKSVNEAARNVARASDFASTPPENKNTIKTKVNSILDRVSWFARFI
jgi:hypothetical protein